MPKFGKASLEKKDTLHPKLQKIMDEAIKHVDFTILEGVRTPERQRELFNQGKSKTLNSKHLPDSTGKSRAVDVILYPIDWSNRDGFVLLAGFLIGIAASMGIKLISGVDWDGDFKTTDHSFFDGPHLELHDSEI